MFGNLAPGRYAVFVSRTRVVSRVRVGLPGEQEQVSAPISAGDGRRYALDAQGRRLIVTVPPSRRDQRPGQIVLHLSADAAGVAAPR